MTLAEALKGFAPAYGVTTVLAAVQSGDMDALKGGRANISTALASAREAKEKQAQAMNAATSDWSYWGYWASHQYWTAVANLLEAAELVGPDALPDVPGGPPFEGVVMDVGSKQERWSRDVLEAARQQSVPK